jgi:hypothetical protein
LAVSSNGFDKPAIVSLGGFSKRLTAVTDEF